MQRMPAMLPLLGWSGPWREKLLVGIVRSTTQHKFIHGRRLLMTLGSLASWGLQSMDHEEFLFLFGWRKPTAHGNIRE